MAPPKLTDMPAEVLEQIAGRCTLSGLGALRRTCSACRRLQDDRARRNAAAVYSRTTQHMVEDVANRRNAVFAELHKLPPAETPWLTVTEYVGVYARADDMTKYTAAAPVFFQDYHDLEDDGRWQFTARDVDKYFVQVFVVTNPRIHRNSPLNDMIESVSVFVGDRQAVMEYDIKHPGTYYTDVHGGQRNGGVNEEGPLEWASQKTVGDPAPSFLAAVVQDIVALFHNQMLRYFARV